MIFPRAQIAVHGTAGNNRDLQRLESFFGVDSPYVARRHHRDSRGTWVESEEADVTAEQPAVQDQAIATEKIESPSSSSPQLPAVDTEKLLEAPTAALERLTQLTNEQLTNLQNASQQAGVILNDLKGSAEAGAGSLLSNLEDVQRQLAPEVQSQVEKVGTVLEKQVNEAQDVLMEAIKAIKQQAETLSQQASSSLSSSSSSTNNKVPAQAKQKQAQKTSTNVSSASSELDSVALRFKTEMQQLTEKIKTMSGEQLQNIQEVVVAMEKELVQRSEQMRSFISEKRVEINQTIGQVTAQKTATPAQQQQQKKVAVAVKATAPPAAKKKAPEQQKSQAVSSADRSIIDRPVQQLSRTAEAVKGIWQDKVQTKINKINLPSVSVPTAITNFDASKAKTIAAENPQAVALGAGVLAVTAVSMFLRKKAGNSTQAEQDAVQRARSRRRLDRQRNRFKQALGNDDDGTGMIDSSVFAAVQRIQSSKAVAAPGTSTGAASGGSVDEEEDDDEEEGGALGSDPQSWDPEMKKEWNKFVKSSKLKDAELWDPNQVDEGLPEIYVDLERD